MRRIRILSFILIALGAGLLVSAGQAGAQDTAPNITVTSVPTPGEGGCLPAREGASVTIADTPTEVVMTVNARVEVCGEVTAVIYSMPDNRLFPWPQTKVEAETFTIKPGVTTVRFTKGCAPVQFDLVTGPTPEVIRPDTGPMHGPLLFDDLLGGAYTGVQHWGTGCNGTTSTTSTTTTPSTSTSTTSSSSTSTTSTSTTAPAQVLSSTTVLGSANTVTTPTIAGVTQGRTDPSLVNATSPQSGTALAATGVPADILGAWGAVLMISGLLLLCVREAIRQRR